MVHKFEHAPQEYKDALPVLERNATKRAEVFQSLKEELALLEVQKNRCTSLKVDINALEVRIDGIRKYTQEDDEKTQGEILRMSGSLDTLHPRLEQAERERKQLEGRVKALASAHLAIEGDIHGSVELLQDVIRDYKRQIAEMVFRDKKQLDSTQADFENKQDDFQQKLDEMSTLAESLNEHSRSFSCRVRRRDFLQDYNSWERELFSGLPRLHDVLESIKINTQRVDKYNSGSEMKVDSRSDSKTMQYTIQEIQNGDPVAKAKAILADMQEQFKQLEQTRPFSLFGIGTERVKQHRRLLHEQQYDIEAQEQLVEKLERESEERVEAYNRAKKNLTAAESTKDALTAMTQIKKSITREYIQAFLEARRKNDQAAENHNKIQHYMVRRYTAELTRVADILSVLEETSDHPLYQQVRQELEAAQASVEEARVLSDQDQESDK